MKKVAIAAPFQTTDYAGTSAENCLNAIASIALTNVDISFSIIDAYSLSSSGQLEVVDPLTQQQRTGYITEFDLVHFLELELPSHQKMTCGEKWGDVYTMLDAIATFPVKCVNRVDAIRYCADKSYLLHLQSGGIPIIPTAILNASIPFEEIKRRYRHAPFIVKPLRGECGRHVYLLNAMNSSDFEALRKQDDRFLIQPFRDEIRAGEISLLFFNGEFSHAFTRKPHFTSSEASYGLPQQREISIYQPNTAELAFGCQVYNAFLKPLHIYRVDFIKTATGYLLMEVESVDPYHYSLLNPSYGQTIGNFYRNQLT